MAAHIVIGALLALMLWPLLANGERFLGTLAGRSSAPPTIKTTIGKTDLEAVGTDERPFVIKVNPADTDKAEAGQREAERKDKAQSDRDLVYWTRVLAGLALAQFAALVIQAFIFLTQARRLKETVDEMRTEFISTHRPRLMLRGAYALEDNDGREVVTYYTIANIGNTAARIVESALEIQFEGERSSTVRLPPASVGRNDIGPIELEGGGHHAGDIKPSKSTVWPIPEPMYLVLTGHIVYADQRGVMRHMGIRRFFDPVNFLFYRRNGESDQLDYAD